MVGYYYAFFFSILFSSYQMLFFHLVALDLTWRHHQLDMKLWNETDAWGAWADHPGSLNRFGFPRFTGICKTLSSHAHEWSTETSISHVVYLRENQDVNLKAQLWCASEVTSQIVHPALAACAQTLALKPILCFWAECSLNVSHAKLKHNTLPWFGFILDPHLAVTINVYFILFLQLNTSCFQLHTQQLLRCKYHQYLSLT